MHEIELNRASNMIDPSLTIWGWEIPVYLFLGGVTAGIMILAPLVRRRGGTPPSRWARLAPFAAPVLISVGMLALFLDLAHKLHVLRFYAFFRPSSPMSWGAWILLAIYPVTLLAGLAGMNDGETRAVAGFGPVSALRLGGLIERARAFARAHEKGLDRASIALGIGLGGYTGLLLGTLGARQVWSSSVLGPLFLVSGLSTGAALMMLFPLADEERHYLRDLDLKAIGLELALLAVFLIGLVTGGAGGQEAARLFLGGDYTATFWALVVIAGLAVPFAIEAVEARRSLRPTLWAPALLLVGGFALRWILVSAGQA
jgi:formate-dependent nitrite reductase membrane component NrfD